MLIDAKKVMLSPSSLSVFLGCPRCFWLEKVVGVKRPRGIFPSLPGGIDLVLKPYFDRFRKEGNLPKDIESQFHDKVRLFTDEQRLDIWRNWRTGLRYEGNKYALRGAIDDLLTIVDKSGKVKFYAPFDYKTKGSAPKEEDAERYYKHQLDLYALLLEKNNLPTNGEGYLIFYYPTDVEFKTGDIQFARKVISLKTSVARAEELCRSAANCLNGPPPPENPKCEYCHHSDELRKKSALLASTKFGEPPSQLELPFNQDAE